jgi:hypothetical protein
MAIVRSNDLRCPGCEFAGSNDVNVCTLSAAKIVYTQRIAVSPGVERATLDVRGVSVAIAHYQCLLLT